MARLNTEFYKTYKWLKVKNAYLASQRFTCERCGRPATCVHHKTYLTKESVSNPRMTFNFDNLEALCQACHNREHKSKEDDQTRGGIYYVGSKF